MRVTAVNVMYDHPVSAPYDHALLLDFINPSQGVGARVGIELSASSARELVRAIEVALASPEARADLAQQCDHGEAVPNGAHPGTDRSATPHEITR
jgi:hypothetical protein